MRVERGGFMRRFLTLVSLLCLAIPAGITISGCSRNPGQNYCNGLGYGPRVTDVAVITLQPATTGISMAWGQTRQLGSPNATTCKGAAASVSSYIYGSTNRQLVDVSPTGSVCAGTWNRNTGGGIGDFTICSAPKPLPTTNGLPYTTAYLTATANSVTSNPVEVYVHNEVTSLSLVGPTQCLSQGQQWPSPLDVQACYAQGNQQVLLCAPQSVTSSSSPTLACPLPTVGGKQVALSSIPTCPASIGSLSFSVGTPNIALINAENNLITAQLPGTTTITASVAGSGSTAGYFSTCPPASISLTLADGTTKGTITRGVSQNLVTKVTDTQGNPITGLTLDYQSTDPIDISANSAGTLSAQYPGQASVYAVCQPSSCNPSPINVFGVHGTGLSIPSNSVNVSTPGTASAFVWLAAPGASQYFVPVELLTGTVGSTVRLPFVPNSMVMDRTGSSLYFGSDRELMVFSTASNALSKADPNVPGVVLAVSPTNQQVLINDRKRRVLNIYGAAGSISNTIGGIGYSAQWTPDAKTLYVVGEGLNKSGVNVPMLFVFNANTGWTENDLTATGASANLAITVPGVGAYLSGNPTVAHAWCPAGTVGDYASMTFYPQADQVAVQTDVLAATTDGTHILGASASGGTVTLSDIGVTIPTEECPGAAAGLLTGLNFKSTLNTLPLTKVSATAVNQVVTSPASNLAFLTYTGSTPGAPLPYYVPGAAGAAGTLNYLSLTGGNAVTAPLAGAFTADDKLFFVSTAGDNQIHYIDVPTLTDTQQISPKLPACTPETAGGKDPGCVYTGADKVVPATSIAVKPRRTT